MRYSVPREGLYWLALAGLLLFIGWSKSINLLIVLGYLMFLVWLLNVLLAGRGLRGLRADRRIEGPIFAGTPFSLSVALTNSSLRPVIGVHLEQTEMPKPVAWFLVQVPGDTTVPLTHEATLMHRGWHFGGPLMVAARQPFGLVECRVRLLPEEGILVCPRLGRLHLGRLRRWLRYDTVREECHRSAGRPTRAARLEFHGLRPMRSGDSPRWIHWRTSARRGELMVREFEDTLGEDLLLIVDPSADGRPLEDIASFAATVCWVWCRQHGRRLMLVIAGPSPVVCHGETGPALAALTLEALALMQGWSEPGTDALLDRLRHERLPGGALLLVSPRRGPLADVLRERLHRMVACLTVEDLASCDFYERPAADVD